MANARRRTSKESRTPRARRHSSTESDYPVPQGVCVTWVDSASNPMWSHFDDIVKDQHIATCQTLGFLHDLTPTEVRLVGTQSRRKDGSGVFHALSIPRQAVVEIRYL